MGLFQVDLGSQRFWLHEAVEINCISAILQMASSFELLMSQQSAILAQIAQ